MSLLQGVVDRAVRATHFGQQLAMLYACAAVQRAVRGAVIGRAEGFTTDELRALRERYRDLLRRDVSNTEAGLYPRQLLFQIPVGQYIRRLPRLAADLPRIVERMAKGDYKDLPAEIDLAQYPPYYRRTFHWQSDGYLSDHSARLYDVGVEFLFGGTADVMRRQCIPPITRFLRTQGPGPRILDVACGTGRTLAQLRRAHPRAEYSGVDLSPYYIEEARRQLGSDVQLMVGNAEALDLPDDAYDVVVSVFLFHELPRNARRKVFAEMKRVLRPGGQLVIVDSVQRTDCEDIAFFIERFSEEMHEPFYKDYLRDDLMAGLQQAGFQRDGVEQSYLSKVVTVRKPLTRSLAQTG